MNAVYRAKAETPPILMTGTLTTWIQGEAQKPKAAPLLEHWFEAVAGLNGDYTIINKERFCSDRSIEGKPADAQLSYHAALMALEDAELGHNGFLSRALNEPKNYTFSAARTLDSRQHYSQFHPQIQAKPSLLNRIFSAANELLLDTAITESVLHTTYIYTKEQPGRGLPKRMYYRARRSESSQGWSICYVEDRASEDKVLTISAFEFERSEQAMLNMMSLYETIQFRRIRHDPKGLWADHLTPDRSHFLHYLPPLAQRIIAAAPCPMLDGRRIPEKTARSLSPRTPT